MSVLDLASAKQHLNLSASTNDAELQATINAAEAAIAKRVGPLEPTAVTDRIRGGGSALVLKTRPVISLASVTPVGGSAIDPSALDLDAQSGIVRLLSGFTFSDAFYNVTYQAGRSSLPDDLLEAIGELVRHMWEIQRGGSQRPGSRAAEALSNTLPGSAYTFPIRVTELLAPYTPALVM